MERGKRKTQRQQVTHKYVTPICNKIYTGIERDTQLSRNFDHLQRCLKTTGKGQNKNEAFGRVSVGVVADIRAKGSVHHCAAVWICVPTEKRRV